MSLNMPTLAIFITAALLLNGVFCRSAQEVDVDTILEILQTQNDLSQRHGDRSSSASSSDSDDDNSHTLRNREFAKLAQQVSERDKRKQRLDRLGDENYGYKYKNNKYVPNLYNDYTIENRNRYNAQNQYDKKSLEHILEELVSKNTLDKKYLAEQRKVQLLPSTLLDSLKMNKNDVNTGHLNEYSKIFVVLNPRGIETSKNMNKLSDLVSQLVSASTLNEDRSLLGRKEKYRGLPLKDDLFSRRFRRDSKEMYAQKESGEDDYKPKRYRNDRGGGGSGGTGGRTAIPYIRHRGDIYERT